MTIQKITKKERKNMIRMRLIKRLYWLPIGAALAAVLCSLFLCFVTPRKYVSSSGLAVVDFYDKNPTSIYTLINSNAKATTLGEFGLHHDVAQKVIEELSLDVSPDELLDDVFITRERYTMFVTVHAKGKTPEDAVRLLTSYTNHLDDVFKELLEMDELHQLYPPTEPIKENPRIGIVVLAALAGGLISLLVLYFVSLRRCRTIKQYGIPVLGRIDSEGFVTPYFDSQLESLKSHWAVRFNRYFSYLRSRWWIIPVSGLLCGLLVLAVIFTSVPIQHVANGSSIVYRRSVDDKIDMDGVSADNAISIAQTYGSMAGDPIMMQLLADHLPEGLSRPYSAEELKRNITVKYFEDSFEFTYTVKADTAQDALLLCRHLIDFTGETLLSLFGVGHFKNLGVYDETTVEKTVSPTESFFIALVIGAFLTTLLLFLRSSKYIHLISVDDLGKRYPRISILGTLPKVPQKSISMFDAQKALSKRTGNDDE